MKLEGRVAIVTGAATGIGRAIAKAFGKEGASVAIADKDLRGGQEVAGEVTNLGAKALALKCDVSNREEVNAAVLTTIAEFGRIDVLVNNAAYTRWDRQTFRDSDPEEWGRHIDVDFKGVLYCTWATIPYMIEQGGGRIITISSNAGKTTQPGFAVYGACKAAVAGFSRCLAREVGRYGILVNCISPGVIRTPRIDMRIAQKYASATILRRLGEPEDIASMVLFLASEGGNYITAQNFSIDGGMTCSH